jgi:hypothetical protein
MSPNTSRRQILCSALASTSLGLIISYSPLTLAQSAVSTPQCHDGDEATVREAEGPYFKPSSPQRSNLVERNTKGRLVELNGQVGVRSLMVRDAPHRSQIYAGCASLPVLCGAPHHEIKKLARGSDRSERASPSISKFESYTASFPVEAGRPRARI